MSNLVIIGAGIGGLSAAVALCRLGHQVTVLEAHVYPGGCAGTFYHQGYRFDAGATLAGGFYPGGPMDLLAAQAGITTWDCQPEDLVMDVHLPGGIRVPVTGSHARWEIRREVFGDAALPFWEWQESTADALWELALQQPAWPPQSFDQARRLASTGLGWLAKPGGKRISMDFLKSAIEPVAARLKNTSPALRMFVDSQLLISAQTTSQNAVGFYGAAALDLPRRGVAHLAGGVGSIATRLVESIRRLGGRVLFRQAATRIVREKGCPIGVETRRGGFFHADQVIANLTPWNIKNLLDPPLPASLRHLSADLTGQWGAFTLYLGVDAGVIPEDAGLHHQIVIREPLGEGNSIFLSISPAWDGDRAPKNHRAITISTHTRLPKWWTLYENDRQQYALEKKHYQERILQAAEQIFPGLHDAVRLNLVGTPVTFQRFTHRAWGWVGGFPQTSLFKAWGSRLAPGIHMVGDSIFPGQSIAAAALGGMRIASTLGDPSWV